MENIKEQFTRLYMELDLTDDQEAMIKKLQRDVDAALSQQPVINWVAVTDTIPQHRQKVLFATTNGDVHKAIYMDKLINQYGDYNQVFLSNDGGHYQVAMDIVTFWCDIPKPPCL